jgi:hypothetical protein
MTQFPQRRAASFVPSGPIRIHQKEWQEWMVKTRSIAWPNALELTELG